MADNLHDVITQMENFGIPLTDRDLGRVERFTPGKKMTLGKGGKWFAKFYEWVPVSSTRRLMTGYFGSYKTGEHAKVDLSGRQLSAAELNALREARAAQDAAARERAARDQLLAALRAEDRWSRASRVGISPYAVKKGLGDIGAPWVRFERFNGGDGGDTLLVPMCRYDEGRALQGVQAIASDGSKRFGRDVAKQGSAAVIGHHAQGEPVLIGEGWATMGSVWLALDRKYQCVVAFDCGNLLHAARMIHAARPDAPLIFCADDDATTAGNPGRRHANEAYRALATASVGVVVPVFSAPLNAHGKRLTDFNDLHLAEGLPAVAAQLRARMGLMREFGGWR